MPTVTETATETARPDPEARRVLADRAILPVPGGEHATESDGPAPPFEAMVRDPREGMLARGAGLAVPAAVLMITRPDAVAAIPLALPVLIIAAVVGLVLICGSGMALASRRRGRGQRAGRP